MRISTTQMYDNLLTGINRQLQVQATGNEQVSSGTRFQRPSQAGLDYKISLDIRSAQTGVQNSLAGLTVAESRLGISQTTLNDMSNILKSAQSMAVVHGSANVGVQERQNAALQATHLLDQFFNDANQQWQGQSLFAGTAVNTQAFTRAFSAGTAAYTAGANTSITLTQTSNANGINDSYSVTLNAAGTQINSVLDANGVNQLAAPVVLAAGANALNLGNGTVLNATFDGVAQASTGGGTLVVSGANPTGNIIYNGSNQDRTVAISDVQQIVSNVRGDDPAFSTAFTALQDLQTALQNNDAPGVRAALGGLTAAHDQIVNLTSDVGGRMSVIAAYRTSFQDMQASLDSRLNLHEGVDIPAVVSQMQQSSVALQASYSQVSRLQSLSLINFLR